MWFCRDCVNVCEGLEGAWTCTDCMLCGVSPTTLTNKLLQAHNGIAQTLSNGNTTDCTLIPNTENLQRKRLPEDKCTSNKAEVNEG